METPYPADEELALRIPQDPAAFRLLYDRYARRVFGLLKSLGLKGDRADDVAQQAWLKVWKSLPGKPAGSPVGPWLMVVARNAAIDALRKPSGAAVPDGLPAVAGARDGVLDEAVEDEEMRQFRHCLDRLPDLEKRIVQNRLEGIDSPAIAGAVGLTSERVHRLFHDAKKKIQLCLGSDRT